MLLDSSVDSHAHFFGSHGLNMLIFCDRRHLSFNTRMIPPSNVRFVFFARLFYRCSHTAVGLVILDGSKEAYKRN